MEENIRIRNKAAAELQITSEQILLEAYERKDAPLKTPRQRIEDVEELREYQLRKRREYEQQLNKNRLNFGQWLRYAQFEVEQHDFARARSVFERALDVDYQHIPIWVRYIQTEIKGRNINHARNVLDRAVTLLPRVDKLWYLYVQTEEALGNVIGVRNVFERWTQWEPPLGIWSNYVNFEKRYDEVDLARKVLERMVMVHPGCESWLKWVSFEKEIGDRLYIRTIYSLAADSLLSLNLLESRLLVDWAKWEASIREYERSRAIYKQSLELLPHDKHLSDNYTAFEKQYGEKNGIEDAILSKRKNRYEEELKEDPSDYDTWWAYVSLMEEYSTDYHVIHTSFENAVENAPIKKEKRYWRRYIFLWIRYVLWEEVTNGNVEKARSIYDRMLKLIPHKQFTFAKIWILYAKFEIRHGDLTKARRLLGRSLGMCAKPSLFKNYIRLEIKLQEYDRARTLYMKYIETFPGYTRAWLEFAAFETNLSENERTVAIYELALSQSAIIEQPQLVWKQYIEYFVDSGEYNQARHLYERLLDENLAQVKLWISFALFEVGVPSDEQLDEHRKLIEETGDEEIELELVVGEEAKERARKVFEKAITYCKDQNNKENRTIVLEALKLFEETHGSGESVETVIKRLPTVVKKTKIDEETGNEGEYLDYVFPDDNKTNVNVNKFLENARKWMLQKEAEGKS